MGTFEEIAVDRIADMSLKPRSSLETWKVFVQDLRRLRRAYEVLTGDESTKVFVTCREQSDIHQQAILEQVLVLGVLNYLFNGPYTNAFHLWNDFIRATVKGPTTSNEE